MTTTTTARPLYFTEHYMHQVSCDFLSSLICCWAHGTGRVTVEQVREAMHVIYDRHPFLRCRITGEAEKYVFNFDVPFDSVSFEVVELKPTDDFTSAVDTQLNSTLPTGGPLWAARLMHTPEAGDKDGLERWTLLLLLSHSIADGRSVTMLLDELGSILAELLQGGTPDRTSRPIPDPIEAQLVPHGTIDGFNAMFEKWQSQFDHITPWATNEATDLTGQHCHITCTVHDADFSKRLAERCHREGTTMQGAFAAAYAMGIAECRDSEGAIDIDTLTPVDLRSKSDRDIDPHELACKIITLPTGSKDVSSTSDPWVLARDYKKMLTQQFQEMASLPFEFGRDDIASFLSGFIAPPNEFNHGLNVSNLGRLPTDGDHGPIQIEGIDLVANIKGMGFPILVEICSYRGQLRCTYTWIEPLISREHALKLIGIAESRLESMVDEG